MSVFNIWQFLNGYNAISSWYNLYKIHLNTALNVTLIQNMSLWWHVHIPILYFTFNTLFNKLHMVLNTISEGGFMSYMTLPSCKKMNVFGACLRQGGLSFFWVFNKLKWFWVAFPTCDGFTKRQASHKLSALSIYRHKIVCMYWIDFLFYWNKPKYNRFSRCAHSHSDKPRCFSSILFWHGKS